MRTRVINSLRNPPFPVLKGGSLLRRNYSAAGVSDVEVNFDNNRSVLKLETGKYARLADGCAVAELGNTSVMVTAVSRTKPSTVSFLPLTVDYRQKAAAAGRIPTNFLRRELGASDQEILVGRLIDRSLRPLFPRGFNYETQIMCNLLAVDSAHDPEVLSINAASAALAVSDIPWSGPIGAVRLGFIDNEFIVNPTRRELANSILNLVVSATAKNLIVMIEGSAKCILQQDLMSAVKLATRECQKIVSAISMLQQIAGKEKRTFTVPAKPTEELVDSIRILCEMRLRQILSDFSLDKLERDKALRDLKDDVIDKTLSRNEDIKGEVVAEIFDAIFKELFRMLIFDSERRCDGRAFSDLRDISCRTDLYKPLHGSALFQRGQTQVLCTVALDSIDSSLKLDPVSAITSGLKEKNFFLHYEFPPFATKEIGRVGPAQRRELGHGALAERGLRPVIPSDFPFAIRLTSEVLESNGSSSMASVCGGSLALMDAGVPIAAPAAGVAIGLVSRPSTEKPDELDYRILTDILGIEDYLGDMDFKIAGTKKGITALQADIKLPGIPLKIVMEAITAGVEAKSKIIGIMNREINQPRLKKENWPVSEALDIPAHQRGKFVGAGGINLRRLMAETGAQVSSDEEGNFTIFAPNQDAMAEGKEFISKLLEASSEPTLEFGCIYTAKIVEVRESGVMVTLYNNMHPALLHNSQLDHRKVSHPSALGLEVGQEIQVKYFGRDPVSGVMRLSRKVIQGPSTVVRNLS